MLFSIEATSSYYLVSNYWKGFFCAICGAFVFSMLRVFGDTSSSTISLFHTAFEPFPYTPKELILFICLAVICGLAAAAFVKFNLSVVVWRRKYQKKIMGSNPFVVAAVFTIFATIIKVY